MASANSLAGNVTEHLVQIQGNRQPLLTRHLAIGVDLSFQSSIGTHYFELLEMSAPDNSFKES